MCIRDRLKIAAKAKRNAAKYTPKNSEVVVSVDDVSKSYKMGKTRIEAVSYTHLTLPTSDLV